MNRRELFKGMLGAPVPSTRGLFERIVAGEARAEDLADEQLKMHVRFIEAGMRSYRRVNLLELEANTRR